MSLIALYLGYFVVSITILVSATWIYTKLTAYDDLDLIANGNTAAAIVLGGFIIGVSLPISSTVFHSINIIDMIIWSLVAVIAQMLIYLAFSKLFFKTFNQGIESNLNSYAILLSCTNIGFGLINSACIS